MKIKVLLFLTCCLVSTMQARFERVPTQTRVLLQGQIKQVFAHNRELCKKQLVGSQKALDSCYHQKPILGGLLTRKALRFSLFGPVIVSMHKQSMSQLQHEINLLGNFMHQLPALDTVSLAALYQNVVKQ